MKIIRIVFILLLLSGCATKEVKITQQQLDNQKRMHQKQEVVNECIRQGADAVKRIAATEMKSSPTKKKVLTLGDGLSTAAGPPENPIDTDIGSINRWKRNTFNATIAKRQTTEDILWQRFKNGALRGGKSKLFLLIFLSIALIAAGIWIKFQYGFLYIPYKYVAIAVWLGVFWMGYKSEIMIGVRIIVILILIGAIIYMVKNKWLLHNILANFELHENGNNIDPQLKTKLNTKIAYTKKRWNLPIKDDIDGA